MKNIQEIKLTREEKSIVDFFVKLVQKDFIKNFKPWEDKKENGKDK